MVVSRVNKEILEIAARKIFDLSKTNPRYRQLCEQLHLRRAAVADDKMSIRQKFGMSSSTTNMDTKGCSPSCISKSVIDIFTRRTKLFTFQDACNILIHCHTDEHLRLIDDSIRKYGIVIIGFPECTDEDLRLAVYFFIEDMFGIQPNIQFCVRTFEEDETDTVEVIFNDVATKEQIIKKLHILEGSGIEIDSYFDIGWIVDCLYPDWDL